MSSETNISIGNRITIGEITERHPAWSLHVKPGNRHSGATGKVVGFYRMDEDLISVQHDDGTSGVYTAGEVVPQ